MQVSSSSTMMPAEPSELSNLRMPGVSIVT